MGLRNFKSLSALSAGLLLGGTALTGLALTGTALTGTALTATAALAEPVTAPWSGKGGEQVQKLKSQRLEAFTSMGPAQRQGFFQAQRSLEERFSRQRLGQLNQSERCLDQARGQSAVDTCLQTAQQARRDLRRQEMAEWQALNQRFGLPTPQGRGSKQKAWGAQPKPGV
jgi:hypothetical protein